jgi:hypothetical protein
MATLQVRLTDLITQIGADMKARVVETNPDMVAEYRSTAGVATPPATGSLSSLTTTDKSSLVAGINEVNAKTPRVVVVTNYADAGTQPSGTLVISTSGN